MICDLVDEKKNYKKNFRSRDLIEFVSDRPGHDLRYAIDATKIKKELLWEPKKPFEKGLSETIDWYLKT